MAERIIEGLWDCPYCQSKGIGGLSKHCPCCGHPQDEGTHFYLGEQKKYLEDDLAKQYGQGADWVCPFCGSLNRVHYKFCANCASAKDAAEKDYFGAKTAQGELQAAATQPSMQPEPPKKKRWIVPAILIALAALLAFVFWPRTYDATVSSAAWARTIDIEAFRTVQESDWSVPAGGQVYDQKSEISHYAQVLDHYETRTREVSEEVYDGEDEHTSYIDNGDGTFSESTYSSPRYRTQWHTETYQEPVYRSDPVYATKYYYNIDKWLIDRTVSSNGTDSEPSWPTYTLASNERTGSTSEAYTLTLATKKNVFQIALPLNTWALYKQGDAIQITVVSGKVTKLNDQQLN